MPNIFQEISIIHVLFSTGCLIALPETAVELTIGDGKWNTKPVSGSLWNATTGVASECRDRGRFGTRKLCNV
jgi:hypothetical protein